MILKVLTCLIGLTILIGVGCSDANQEEALWNAERMLENVWQHTRGWTDEYGDCRTDYEYWIDMSVAETQAEYIINTHKGFSTDEQLKQILIASKDLIRAHEQINYACDEDE